MSEKLDELIKLSEELNLYEIQKDDFSKKPDKDKQDEQKR